MCLEVKMLYKNLGNLEELINGEMLSWTTVIFTIHFYYCVGLCWLIKAICIVVLHLCPFARIRKLS
jgi:hypothetical protein